jgi:hypothetical protein
VGVGEGDQVTHGRLLADAPAGALHERKHIRCCPRVQVQAGASWTSLE